MKIAIPFVFYENPQEDPVLQQCWYVYDSLFITC
jgi:hypothetical protein